MAVELEVLRRHASYRSLSGKETGELQPDVAGSCAIAILWQLAVLILANAQAANFFSARANSRLSTASSTRAICSSTSARSRRRGGKRCCGASTQKKRQRVGVAKLYGVIERAFEHVSTPRF